MHIFDGTIGSLVFFAISKPNELYDFFTVRMWSEISAAIAGVSGDGFARLLHRKNIYHRIVFRVCRHTLLCGAKMNPNSGLFGKAFLWAALMRPRSSNGKGQGG